MASILAAGTTPAQSSTVTLASGVNANLVGYVAVGNGGWNGQDELSIYLNTTGEAALVGKISEGNRRFYAVGPGTYVVVRGNTASAIGCENAA